MAEMTVETLESRSNVGMGAGVTAPAYDLDRVRAEFPALAREVHGKPLVYLDNAATTQKPRAVIEAVSDVYTRGYANVGRGVYRIAEEATAAYEAARATVARFLGAASKDEIVFVRGTTEAINLVAQSWGRANVDSQKLTAGDEILVTEIEHHANLVPWQMLAKATGATLRAVPLDDAGEVPLEAFRAALSPRTKIAAFTHVSNVLGTVLPIAEMIAAAREVGAVTLVDGAQGAPHAAPNVCALGCDFYAFSGHKAYGPGGIGVLYGRREVLAAMPPWHGGGGMIEHVGLLESTYAPPPARFEAGTPNLEGAVGLAAAIDFVEVLGRDAIAAWEGTLGRLAVERLGGISGVRLHGRPPKNCERTAVISFEVEGVHPHDLATILDREGVAVRAGHHCAQPLMAKLGVVASARASFALYNTVAEVEALGRAVEKARGMFARGGTT